MNEILIEAAKRNSDKASKLSPPATAARDPKSKDDTSESFEIDKACSDIKYLIGVFKQLLMYGTYLSDPLITIQKNVDNIVENINSKQR